MTPPASNAPEAKARELIDADLAEAGWIVQHRKEMNVSAGRGVAVREFKLKTGHGFADYLLFVDQKANVLIGDVGGTGGGGAMFIGGNLTDFAIGNSTFSENSAQERGGAIYVSGGVADLTLENVTLNEGFLLSSSAVYSTVGASVTARNTIVQGRCDGDVSITTGGGNIGMTCSPV